MESNSVYHYQLAYCGPHRPSVGPLVTWRLGDRLNIGAINHDALPLHGKAYVPVLSKYWCNFIGWSCRRFCSHIHCVQIHMLFSNFWCRKRQVECSYQTSSYLHTLRVISYVIFLFFVGNDEFSVHIKRLSASIRCLTTYVVFLFWV